MKLKMKFSCQSRKAALNIASYIILSSSAFAQLSSYKEVKYASSKLPIIQERTIAFITDEGSYMNIDVSPDGKMLVFDLLGDLYTVPVTGGNAVQLTQGVALNLRPVWSPDNKKIAYVSDNEGDFTINVLNIKTKSNYLLTQKTGTYNKNAIWSPDENFILFDKYIYGVAGGEFPIPKSLGSGRIIRFSKDGKTIFSLCSGRICSYDFKLKKVDTLSKALSGASWEREIALSADAKWCVYVSEQNSKRELIAVNLQHNTNKVILSSSELYSKPDYKFTNSFSHFSFSPDCKTLFISYGGKIHQIDVESGDDQIIPFFADVKVGLGKFNYNRFKISDDSFQVKYIRSANLKPDGTQLVFGALNKIYIMDLPNGKPRLLVSQSMGQFDPVYSPDGKWISYVSWADTSGGFLWKIPSNGGEPIRLTTIAGNYQHPSWSPDMQNIALIRGDVKFHDYNIGKGQLITIPFKGGDARIIDTIPLWNLVSFSFSENKIIYQKSLNSEILGAKNLDNGFFQQLVESSGGSGYYPPQITISPDERYIVYTTGDDLYLLPVFTGKKSEIISNENKVSIPAIRFSKGMDPYWDKNGIIHWTYSNKFFTVNPDKIILLAKHEYQKRAMANLKDTNVLTIIVNPDEIVSINLKLYRDNIKGVIALKNSRIITMHSNEIIEKGTVLIKNNRIIQVGPKDKVIVPNNAMVIDLNGSTIVPGFVDMHLHFKTTPNVFSQQSWQLLSNLAYGVTTARNPSSNFDSFGYSELLEAGQMIGPRVFSVGRAVASFHTDIMCNSIEDAESIVDKRKTFGCTLIKQYDLPSRIQRQWLLLASKKGSLNMTNEGDYNTVLQLGMIKDGSTGIEHNPFFGEIYTDVVKLIAKSGTFLTPTLQAAHGINDAKEYMRYKFWDKQYQDVKLKNFWTDDALLSLNYSIKNDTGNLNFLRPAKIDAAIRHAGGKVTVGSHGEDQGIGIHNEIWALQMGGLTNMEALQAATIMGAEGLGLQRDIGSIEVGKIADLIILNSNPLDDIHNTRDIKYVMKNGVLYDGDTLDEIWPEKKKCPEWRMKGEKGQ